MIGNPSCSKLTTFTDFNEPPNFFLNKIPISDKKVEFHTLRNFTISVAFQGKKVPEKMLKKYGSTKRNFWKNYSEGFEHDYEQYFENSINYSVFSHNSNNWYQKQASRDLETFSDWFWYSCVLSLLAKLPFLLFATGHLLASQKIFWSSLGNFSTHFLLYRFHVVVISISMSSKSTQVRWFSSTFCLSLDYNCLSTLLRIKKRPFST